MLDVSATYLLQEGASGDEDSNEEDQEDGATPLDGSNCGWVCVDADEEDDEDDGDTSDDIDDVEVGAATKRSLLAREPQDNKRSKV